MFMFRKLSAVLLIVAVLFVIGCAAHTHKIGKGAQGGPSAIVARQWYIGWGLAPINTVDTNTMADGAADYEIRTSITPVDFIISAVGSVVSVRVRTVTVQR